jgi:hypothetical protein
MGLPSPYATMAFPNNPPMHSEYLDFEGVSRGDIERWKSTFMWFLKRVALKNKGRIVLKSPTHLGRIRVLLEMFPEARFVHIVRDPQAIFPSTVKLWKSLSMVQGLQVPKCVGLEEYVFSCFERMYSAFEAQRDLIDPRRFFEVRYEDLVQDPVSKLRDMYEHLHLGDIGTAMPAIEQYLRTNKDYKRNRFQLDPQIEAEIDRRWGPYMRRYGYCQGAPEPKSEIMPQPSPERAAV